MLPAAAVRLEAAGCITALGDAASTHAALLRGDPSEYEQVYQQWLSDLFVASRYLHGDEQAKSP